jgi:uncharacterized protein (DUF433 family)
MERAKIDHPYVEADERICGGAPVIMGTRVRVVDMAIEYEYLSKSPDEIITSHPHLKLEQVHDALSYYYENREKLDEKIRKDKQFVRELAQNRGAQ